MRLSPPLLLAAALFAALLAPLGAEEPEEEAGEAQRIAALFGEPAQASSDQAPSEPTDSSSVDDLFKDPQADTETKSSNAAQLLTPFHAQPLTVTGSLKSTVGIVAGYTDVYGDDGEYAGTRDLNFTPGLNFVPAMTFVARPDETIRFQGTISFPFGAQDIFAPVINEMFFDYTLQDKIYLRIGKHLISWGVTRIFGAGSDLMAGSSDDLGVKATVPVGSGGFTTVLLMPQSFVSEQYSWRELTTGLQASYPFGRSEFILSGTYFGDDSECLPLRTTAIVKTSLWDVDLFAEGIWATEINRRPEFSMSPSLNGFVSGFFWQKAEIGFKVYGEYYYDARDDTGKSQFFSSVASLNRVFRTPLDLVVQWSQAFIDGSGILIPGFSVKILPHITMQVGLPFRYGEPGSFYLVNQSPQVQTAVVPTKTLSWQQRYGFMFRLNLSTDF